MSPKVYYRIYGLLIILLAAGNISLAQTDASAKAWNDPKQVLVGDRSRVFLEVQHNPATSKVVWTALPDSLGKLELIEKDKIDTLKQGALVTYKQRLQVSGFDSGAFYVPSFTFTIQPTNGSAYTISTDSLPLLVQTVAVDTTKAFKPIKAIIEVKNSWRDYIAWIIGGALFVIIAIVVILYFIRSKKVAAPVTDNKPVETLQEKAMKMLVALEDQQVWQKGKVKEYYVELTDIVRGYVEARFNTSVLELTTDELLDKAKYEAQLMPIVPQLEMILRTADLAKFAKAQPMPQEHVTAMQLAKDIVATTRPVIIETPSTPAKS